MDKRKQEQFFYIFYNTPIDWCGIHYNSWYEAYCSEKNIPDPTLTAVHVFENAIELITPLKLAKDGKRVWDICRDYKNDIYPSSKERDSATYKETGKDDKELKKENWTNFVLSKNEVMKCGLKAKITDYDINTGNIRILYEDGTEYWGTHSAYIHKKIAHPTLKGAGWGTFCGFKTKKTTNKYIDGVPVVYYDCECQKCGLKDILTPQQMMEHAKTHEFQEDGIGKPTRDV